MLVITLCFFHSIRNCCKCVRPVKEEENFHSNTNHTIQMVPSFSIPVDNEFSDTGTTANNKTGEV